MRRERASPRTRSICLKPGSGGPPKTFSRHYGRQSRLPGFGWRLIDEMGPRWEFCLTTQSRIYGATLEMASRGFFFRNRGHIRLISGPHHALSMDCPPLAPVVALSPGRSFCAGSTHNRDGVVKNPDRYTPAIKKWRCVMRRTLCCTPGNQCQSSFEAMAAPSARHLSFAHMIERCTRPASGLCENPQSVPAITLSRPTMSA